VFTLGINQLVEFSEIPSLFRQAELIIMIVEHDDVMIQQ